MAPWNRFPTEPPRVPRWSRFALAVTLALVAACGGPRTPRLVVVARPHPAASPDAAVPVIQQRGSYVPGERASDASVPGAAAAAGDYLARIDDEPAWAALAATPGRELAARTEVVKVVVDLDEAGRVYFLNTRRWELHYYFIQRLLARPGRAIPDPEAFWQREYLSQRRSFVQATLVRYRDQDLWTFELVAQDVLDVPRALAAFRAVRDRGFFGARLRYRPVPSHHVAAIDAIRAEVPVVTTDEIFAGTRYQPLNTGEAYGFLRVFDGALDPSRVRPFDVVVLARTPLDLPVVAGVITAELQAPLSHIAVLSANRGTPNMALRGATRDPRVRALDGRLVRLRVAPQDFALEPASQADANRAWAARRPARDFHPRRSDRDVGLPGLAQLRRADVDTVGAKAAQLGELAHVTPALALPRAFAVPFRAYIQHLRRNGIEAELGAFLASADFRNDAEARAQALARVRDRISAAPVDPALVARIRARVRADFPGARVRFRSSTNAEDLEGFNGAGIYTSAGAPANPTDAQVADALRRVWASTWNFQAYEEREWYRVAHAEVAMGVLVQESIDDDQVVGVAITANPFDQGRPAFFVNAQLSAGSVTSAGDGEVPEQVLYYTYPATGAVERLSSSSRAGGRAVMADAEVRALAAVLEQIHRHFVGDPVLPDGRAMDVEFLFAGPTRRVVIVQARPYQVRWHPSRAWVPAP